jgi:hypothetical protein
MYFLCLIKKSISLKTKGCAWVLPYHPTWSNKVQTSDSSKSDYCQKDLLGFDNAMILLFLVFAAILLCIGGCCIYFSCCHKS